MPTSFFLRRCDRSKFLKLKADLERNTDCRVVSTEENLSNLLKQV